MVTTQSDNFKASSVFTVVKNKKNLKNRRRFRRFVRPSIQARADLWKARHPRSFNKVLKEGFYPELDLALGQETSVSKPSYDSCDRRGDVCYAAAARNLNNNFLYEKVVKFGKKQQRLAAIVVETDLRRLFSQPKKAPIRSPRVFFGPSAFHLATRVHDRAVAYLGTLPFFGPLTKGEHYRRQQKIRLSRQAARMRGQQRWLRASIKAKSIGCLLVRYGDVYSYVRTSSINYPPPRKNRPGKVVATSKRQVKVRNTSRFFTVPKSQLRTDETKICPPFLRDAGLKRTLREKIVALRDRRCGLGLSDLQKKNSFDLETVLNKYRYTVPQNKQEEEEKDVDINDVLNNKEVDIGGILDKYRYLLPQNNILEPQGDVDNTGENLQELRCKNDTIIVDQRAVSKATTGPAIGKSYARMAASEEQKSLPALHTRNLPIATINWSTSSPEGTIIGNYYLPIDPVKKNPSNPIALLFKQHRFFRGDMRVETVINCNKFMTGQLMISWYYGWTQDADATLYDNIYSSSQKHHVLNMCGSSNSSSIIIPYVHPLPYVPIKKRTYDDSELDLGKLYVQVINQLQTASTSYQSCNVTLYLSLENVSFVGMVDSSLAIAQMEAALGMLAIDVAESYLVSSFRDQNRDAPTLPINPNRIMINNIANLSVGTNLPKAEQVLRLNPSGQTPHYDLNRSEMFTNSITSIWGLVSKFKWDHQRNSGDLLAYYEASPLWTRSMYQEIQYNNQNNWVVPPVGVIASLFKQWRGKLEMRFDFVSNQFYTGSILCAYLPGIVSPVTYEVAKASGFTMFSLQEDMRLIFTIEYITNRPWWPRRYGAEDNQTDFPAPGSVQIFVVNPLIPMESIPSSIEVNVYLRGGPDFEVSVPIQPALSSGFNTYFPDQKNLYTYPASNYTPFYAGTSRYFRADNKAIFRYGPSDDHLTLWENTQRSVGYYKLVEPSKGKKMRGLNELGQLSNDSKYFWPVLYAGKTFDSSGNAWLFPHLTEADAIKFATTQSDTLLINYPNDDYDWDIEALKWNGYPKWIFVPVTTRVSRPVQYEDDPSLAYSRAIMQGLLLDAQAEERNTSEGKVDCQGVVLQSTDNGYITFGERFISLTNLIRRQQLYCTITSKAGQRSSNLNICYFHVLPQGPVIKDSSVGDIIASVREGASSIIASGFRFYRGSVRLTIVVTPNAECRSVFVQHHPEVQFDKMTNSVTSATPKSLSQFNQGYATIIQDVFMNPIIEVEVPYYLNSVYGYLKTPRSPGDTSPHTSDQLSTLGVITMGCVNPIKSSFTFEATVYYGMGDDMRYETFQGFPPMKFVQFIQPQAGEEELQSQGLVSSHFKQFKKASNVIERADDLLTEAPKLWDKLCSQFSHLSKSFSFSSFMVILNQCAHIAINPHLPTVALGIATILIVVFKMSYNFLNELRESITSFLSDLFQSKSSYGIEPQGPEDCLRESPMEVYGVLFAAVAGLLGYAVSPTGMFINNLRRSFSDVSILSRGVKGFVDLLEYFVKTVKKIFNYIVYKRSGVPDIHALLHAHGEEMIKWGKECEHILNPEVVMQHENNAAMPDLVCKYYMAGTIYLGQLTACQTTNVGAFQYVKSIVDRLRELRDRFIKMGKHPYTKKTPFSLWLNGSPGLGKSSMVTTIGQELLKAVNYDFKGTLLYKPELINGHWDNCRNQPIIQIDDAFAVTTPTALESQLSTYFSLITNAPFTPPMAHLENKYLMINPHIVISCSNLAFPKPSGIAVLEALYRRRHVMVTVKMRPEFDTASTECIWDAGNVNLKGFTKAQKDKFAWLHFYFHKNPRDSADDSLLGPFEYDQFINTLKQNFKTHYEAETEAYNHRINAMYNIDIKDIMEGCSVDEQVTTKVDKIKKSAKGFWQEIKDFVSVNKTPYKLIHKKELENIIPPSIDNEVAGPSGLQSLTPQGETGFRRPEGGRTIEEVVDFRKEVEQNVKAMIDKDKLKLSDSERKTFVDYYTDYEVFVDGLFAYYRDDEYRECYEDPIYLINFFKKLNITETSLACEGEDAAREYMLKVGDVTNKHLDPLNIKIVQGYINRYIQSVILMKKCPKKINCKHTALMKCKCVTERDFGEAGVFLVPTCKECFDKQVIPQPFTFCTGSDCCLRYAQTYKQAFKHTTYKIVSVIGKVILQLCTGTFSMAVSISKSILKASLSIGKWIIMQTCKYLIKMIIPSIVFCGTVFGALYYQKETRSMPIKDKLSCVKKGWLKLFDAASGTEYLVPEGTVYESHSQTKGVGRPSVKGMVAKHLKISGQMGMEIKDSSYIDDVTTRVKKNTFMLITEFNKNNATYSFKARGIFFRGRQALFVRHCIDEVLYRYRNYNGVLALVKSPTVCFQLREDSLKILPYEDSNFCVVEFPTSVPEAKNLIKNIPDYKGHQRVINRGCLIEVTDKVKVIEVDIEYTDIPKTISHTENSDSVTMNGCYKYNYGGAGVCGSILLGYGIHPCILGMHVAGIKDREGYSEPLIYEMFTGVPRHPLDANDIIVPDLNDIDLSKIELDTNLLQLGTVEPQYAHNESGKTSIVPSAVHGIFDVATEPAPLSPNDDRLPGRFSPMKYGCEKHGLPCLGFPRHLLDFARDSLKQELRVKVKPVIGVKPLSLIEAIEGRPGEFGYASLNFHTSEGFPLSAFRPAGSSDKRWLFDLQLTNEGFKVKGLDKKLHNILSFKQTLREKDIKPYTVFVDCLKDSRIPKEKIIIPGKTRVFSISPVDFSIQFRQYFLPYLVAHQSARNIFSSGVGMNVHGWEWTSLVWKMGGHSQFHLCGDYSNFGAGFSGEVHGIVAECLLDWFSFHGDSDPINERVRKVMFGELINSYHLCFNLIYNVFCGMPSGSPITVETNDLVNLSYMLMGWHEIMAESKYNSYYYFLKYVKIKTYGDDVWLSVHKEVIEKFNNKSLSLFFAKYGVVYTDADKSSTMLPFRELHDVSFLKCKPFPHPYRRDVWIAQLDRRSVLDIANWCYKSHDLGASTIVNLEACSDAMYGFGVEEHEKIRKILMHAANKLGFAGNFRSWQELDMLFLGLSGFEEKINNNIKNNNNKNT